MKIVVAQLRENVERSLENIERELAEERERKKALASKRLKSLLATQSNYADGLILASREIRLATAEDRVLPQTRINDIVAESLGADTPGRFPSPLPPESELIRLQREASGEDSPRPSLVSNRRDMRDLLGILDSLPDEEISSYALDRVYRGQVPIGRPLYEPDET